MSETPVYFVLAQLNSLMTGGLRLALSLWGLSCLSWILAWRWPRWLQLGKYFSAWMVLPVLCALAAGWAVQSLLPLPNAFVQQGIYLALGLSAVAAALLGLQKLSLWRHAGFRLTVLLANLGAFSWCLSQPSFSRSDKVLLSMALALPVTLGLIYFPLTFLNERRLYTSALQSLWLLCCPLAIGIHLCWLAPILAEIPQEGEFYPFINLYNWFLFLAVILYLGNLYIDYWLNQGNHRSKLAISWNYFVALVAVLGLWLHANIFDTLAL